MNDLREWVNICGAKLQTLRDKTSELAAGRYRYGLFVAPCVSLVLIAAAVSGRAEPEAVAEPYVHRVESVTVTGADSYEEVRLFSGRVNARQHADMGFEQGGKLAEVLVDEGESVKRGDVLAILDSELLHIEEREQMAQLREAKAKLRLTENSLTRQTSLKRSGFTSEQRIDELNSEKESLLATIARLDASVASVASRVRKASLVAPFDGVVTRRFADQGVAVNSAQAILRLQQEGAMEVRVGVPVRQALSLSPGQPQQVMINGEGVEAKVLAVGADVHPLTRTLMVRLSLPAQTVAVNGDLATMNLIDVVPQSGFWVPVQAMGGGVRGLWNVYVVVGESEQRFRLQARSVEVHYAQTGRAFVSGDLRDGEAIVATGLQRVVPGQLVRTRMSEQAEALVAATDGVQP